MSHLKYIHCPTCGLTLEEIKEEHKIGCQDCLVVFRETIEQMLIGKMGCITYGGQYVPRQDISKTSQPLTARAVQDVATSDGTSDDYVQTYAKKHDANLARSKIQASVLELKKLLEKSVVAEDYEAAIYFRNEIRRLEKA